jgi:hypothetical protein
MIALLRTAAIALGLLGAFLASQLPEFTQQYRQRLGGAIDELKAIVARFDSDAATNAISRSDALAKLTQSGDRLVRQRGEDAQANIERLDDLETQRQDMETLGPLARVTYFLHSADKGLTSATIRDYQPAVPTTSEGLLTAIIGFIAGWGVVQALAWPLRHWRETKMRRSAIR